MKLKKGQRYFIMTCGFWYAGKVLKAGKKWITLEEGSQVVFNVKDIEAFLATGECPHDDLKSFATVITPARINRATIEAFMDFKHEAAWSENEPGEYVGT